MIKHSTYPSEDELLAHFRGGDEKALKVIFNSFYNRLCLFTTQFTNNSDSAEEIAVDAFHKLWERRAEFSSVQSLKGFLYVCARNAALNCVDKEQRRSKKIFAMFRETEPVEEPVVTQIIYAEVWNEIQKEIDALPEQCAKIIKLLYQMDMTPDEVASELNISRNTVYSQKFRGLAILRSRLSSAHIALLVTLLYPIKH